MEEKEGPLLEFINGTSVYMRSQNGRERVELAR